MKYETFCNRLYYSLTGIAYLVLGAGAVGIYVLVQRAPSSPAVWFLAATANSAAGLAIFWVRDRLSDRRHPALRGLNDSEYLVVGNRATELSQQDGSRDWEDCLNSSRAEFDQDRAVPSALR